LCYEVSLINIKAKLYMTKLTVIVYRLYEYNVITHCDFAFFRCPSNNGKMTYEEFVWFLIAEEDKRQPRRYGP
jgi:hypothetical protein